MGRCTKYRDKKEVRRESDKKSITAGKSRIDVGGEMMNLAFTAKRVLAFFGVVRVGTTLALAPEASRL
jgi:hypothetical protein